MNYDDANAYNYQIALVAIVTLKNIYIRRKCDPARVLYFWKPT